MLSVQEKLKQFYIEDNHYGDLATSIFTDEQQGKLSVIAKQAGVFCGVDIIECAFKIVDPESHIEMMVRDGSKVESGQTLAVIEGRVRLLLTMERIVLNLIQRMSGIATETERIVNAIKHTNVKVVDTRKTTPGIGMFEKYAIKTGGGYNHRRTLNDGIMLKDNHIDFSESLTVAVKKAKQLQGPMDKIEVEIETLEALIEAIKAEVDIIMFDNQTAEQICQYITHVPDNIQTEASGNINFENVVAYAESGVDFISIGSLFYDQNALDISAKVVL